MTQTTGIPKEFQLILFGAADIFGQWTPERYIEFMQEIKGPHLWCWNAEGRSWRGSTIRVVRTR